jgi:hypothetical protein
VTVEDRVAAEALRLNARYVEEVVIGWDLCPWAARAWRAGEVARRVFVDAAPTTDAVSAFVADIAANPATAIGLAIFPRVALAVPAWERFAEQVRRRIGPNGPFLVAAFHPDYRAGDAPPETPAQLVSLIRRTPHPTLQLVRAALLEKLGTAASDQVTRANFAAVTARGFGALEALLQDLARDRDRAGAVLDAGG